MNLRPFKFLCVLALIGCATLPAGQFDNYEIVDCELPGTVIRMGSHFASTGRARALRTTAQDCGIRGGYYVAADQANYETALRVWLPPADAGDAQAQYFVGQIYEKGLGQTPDSARAVSWYRRAAEQGHAPAQTALAMMYERGEVEGRPDPQAALALYRQASGATEALAFAVDVESRDAEIERLRTQIETLRDAARNERDRAQRRQQELDREIQSLRRQLESARGRADAAQIQAAQVALEQAQARRQQEQEDAQISQARLAEHSDHLRRLEAGSESATSSTSAAGLNIELLEPVPIAMRGLLTVRRAVGVEVQTVAARISGAGGAREAWINGVPVEPDAEGRVSADIALSTAATPVQIRAGAAGGAQARLDFLILREDAALPETRSAGGGSQDFGRYHALVIGNAGYRNWEPLGTPHEDARRVSEVLRDRYGFQVTTLIDATRSDILRALAKLRQALGEDDHLLVYYSGHGSWDKANLQGYWVPVDGDTDSVANYVSSSDITDQLSVMRARQILVVADACYSGVLVRSVAEHVDGGASGERVSRLLQQAAVTGRKVLSSGNIREVLDGGAGRHSIFAAAFLRALEGRNEPFEARELYQDLAPVVEHAARGFGEQQEPQFGALRHAGHVGGDFVFVPATARRS